MADNNITWGSDNKILNTTNTDITDYIKAENNSGDSYGLIDDNDYLALGNTNKRNFHITNRIKTNDGGDENTITLTLQNTYSFNVIVSSVKYEIYDENKTICDSKLIFNNKNNADYTTDFYLYKWPYKYKTPFSIKKGDIYFKALSSDNTAREYIQFSIQNSDSIYSKTDYNYRGYTYQNEKCNPSTFIYINNSKSIPWQWWFSSISRTENLIISNIKWDNLKKISTNYKHIKFKSNSGYFNDYFPAVIYDEDNEIENFANLTSTSISRLNNFDHCKNLIYTTSDQYIIQSSNYLNYGNPSNYLGIYSLACKTRSSNAITLKEKNVIIQANYEEFYNYNNASDWDLQTYLSGILSKGEVSVKNDTEYYDYNKNAVLQFAPVKLVLNFTTTTAALGDQDKTIILYLTKDNIKQQTNYTTENWIDLTGNNSIYDISNDNNSLYSITGNNSFITLERISITSVNNEIKGSMNSIRFGAKLNGDITNGATVTLTKASLYLYRG